MMNHRNRRFNRGFALLSAALVLVSCAQTAPEPAPTEAPLAGATIGGPFTLVDQDGKRVSDTDFAGQHRLIYFGYSTCPDVCPVDLQVLMQGLRLAEKERPELARAVQPLFISIDPERDTPAQLKQYVPNFHPRLVGLTGSPEAVAGAADAYLVVYDRREVEGMSDYLMDHTNLAYLIGPRGEPIALIPTGKGMDGNAVTAREVADEILKWTA